MLSSTFLLLAAGFASASPLAKRAGTIECEQVRLQTDFGLQLHLINSATFPPGPNQTQLPNDGGAVLWLNGSDFLSENPSPSTKFELFGFENCNSEFMGWNTTQANNGTETHYFGHLGQTDTEGQGLGNCLTVNNTITTEQMILETECKTTDDEAQLDQWWQLILPNNTNSPILARFIGRRKADFNDQEYFDVHPTQKLGINVPASTFHTNSSYASNYDFELSG